MDKTKLKKSLASLLLTAGALLSCTNNPTQQIPEAKVEQGTFYIDLYEEGEIEAINSINIASPNIPWRFGNLKISNIEIGRAHV